MLTTGALRDVIAEQLGAHAEGRTLRSLATDSLQADVRGAAPAGDAGNDRLALLQYTSGSTALPRGVMLSHANLLRNSEFIRRAFGTSRRSRAVVWLPPYHDTC